MPIQITTAEPDGTSTLHVRTAREARDTVARIVTDLLERYPDAAPDVPRIRTDLPRALATPGTTTYHVGARILTITIETE